MKKVLICLALAVSVIVTTEVLADPVGDCVTRNKGTDTPSNLKTKCTANPAY
jgi:hypothetical protein